jgi:hypothetical protein
LEHLLKIAAEKRHTDSDPRFVGLSLFREDGGFELLQADRDLVREALAAADGNLLWVEVESSSPTAALVQGWPRPWRSGALVLDAVEGDDVVSLYRRVKPVGREAGGRASCLEAWIRVVGPARMASAPLLVDVSDREADITAGDVALPPGCHLLSPPDQVLVRVGAQEGRVKSHA